MDFIFVVGIIVIILIMLLIFKLVKKIVSAILLIIFIFSLISLIFGYFVYKDLTDFNENFKQEPNLFILKENINLTNSGLVSAFSASFSANTTDNSKLDYYSEESLFTLQEQLKTNKYDDALGENYKFFIFDLSILEDSFVDYLEFGDNKIKKEDAIHLLNSQDPFYVLADVVIDQESIPRSQKQEIITSFKKEIKSDEELKNLIFMGFIAHFFSGIEGPFYIITQYKEGNIIIYKESILFLAMKYSPTSILKKQLEALFNKEGEKTKINIDENKNHFIGNVVKQFR